MIGRLRGVVAHEEPSAVTLDVGGVGYDVQVPAGTLGRAQGADNSVDLWVHTVLRSDALELFGFSSELERRVFRLLISVPNVGPRTALGVLSALPVADLVRSVEAGDHVRLTRVPGIGKKTAERLVLELRGKLPLDELRAAAEDGPRAATRSGDPRSRLIAALTNMGYRPAEAERAVQALGPRVGEEPLSELLRHALAELTP